MKGEWLLELLGGEIPARMQLAAADQLATLVREALSDYRLSFDTVETYVTPRRLTAMVTGLVNQQPSYEEERRGPSVDAPEKAFQGFLTSLNQIPGARYEKRPLAKGDFWFGIIPHQGNETRRVLPAIIQQVVDKFKWPKSMRWATTKKVWGRPIEQVLSLYDGQAMDGYLDMEGIQIPFKGTTRGHRFHAGPTPLSVQSFQQYQQTLRENYVVLCHQERQTIIKQALEQRATKLGLTVAEDADLLEEVAGLVEWPQVYLGKIPDEFLTLPREVLVISMRQHQKYFALNNTDGSLASYFGLVANIEAKDNGSTLLEGNARVLGARLADAAFFFRHDMDTGIEAFNAKLAQVTFHADLGSVAQKVKRLEVITRTLAPSLVLDLGKATRAAALAKFDLCTGMVGEFPELQGIMGGIYAIEHNEDRDVATAIAQHYRPQGQHDPLPETHMGKILSLVDKIDTLVAFFGVGIEPTGSKDPFALRRNALGILRLLEAFPSLTLGQVLLSAYHALKAQGITKLQSQQKIMDRLEIFFQERLSAHWQKAHITRSYINAVKGAVLETTLPILLKRVQALKELMQTEVGRSLATVYSRAANIVTIAEEKEQMVFEGIVSPQALTLGPEKALHEVLSDSLPKVQHDIAQHNYKEAITKVAALQPYLADLFDNVIINVEEEALRHTRLNLLAMIRNILQTVADFNQLQNA